jgi:hypothetical protein
MTATDRQLKRMQIADALSEKSDFTFLMLLKDRA